MVKRISRESRVKDVDDYIAKCPKNLQMELKKIGAAIKEVVLY